ncbi:MAG: cysteine desulfurase-like protein [Pirellulaceae bacterium]
MSLNTQNILALREQFPALANCHDGQRVAFFDGPAGTQVHQSVIESMNRYLVECNANKGGVFPSSQASDAWMDEAHQAFADLIGASDPDEIVFGQNMTSLTFALSRSLARTWKSGDEVIVTRLDHDANITPWVTAANDAGVVVRYVDFNPDNACRLNMEQLRSYLNSKTRLVAVGCASNATGGINPVADICSKARDVGALTFLDAVHYAPHGLMDVKEWGCDFLACSAYKFFGPHLGILWGRRELLEGLEAYQVRPAPTDIPGKWMTGTQSFESIAGGMACVDYLADEIGILSASKPTTRREKLQTAFELINEYEQMLSVRLMEGLRRIDGIRIYGVQDGHEVADRVPTFSITHDSIPTPQLARILGEQGIYVWAGNYYALQLTEHLGLEPEGMVRIGALHYNTPDEIDRLLNAVDAAVNAVAT